MSIVINVNRSIVLRLNVGENALRLLCNRNIKFCFTDIQTCILRCNKINGYRLKVKWRSWYKGMLSIRWKYVETIRLFQFTSRLRKMWMSVIERKFVCEMLCLNPLVWSLCTRIETYSLIKLKDLREWTWG